MSEVAAPTIERRRLSGSARTFSRVTIAVDPPPTAAPALDARTVALLQRARALGVTTFDVASTRSPARAERLIAQAFPEDDPEVSVIVGRSFESLVREGSAQMEPVAESAPGAALAESLEQSRRRLAPVPIAVVDWKPGGEKETGDPTRVRVVSTPEEEKSGILWSVRIDPGVSSLPSAESGPVLFSGGLSLLDPALIPLFESATGTEERNLIARDPFSSGRLDGSRFATRSSLAGPGAPPVDLRQLHEEFDPVLRLGFLTEGHRRTLAQAALQFVLHWRWVVTTVVPLPSPERFDEVLGFGTRPSISPEEMERLALVK